MLQCIPLIVGFLDHVAFTRLSITCVDAMHAMVAPTMLQCILLLARVPLVDDFLTDTDILRLSQTCDGMLSAMADRLLP